MFSTSRLVLKSRLCKCMTIKASRATSINHMVYVPKYVFSTSTEANEDIKETLEISDIDKYELWTTDATYGVLKVFDPIKYFIADKWLYFSEDLDLGMGMGILLTSIGIRLLFTPLTLLAQKHSLKYRLIKEDIAEVNIRKSQLKDDPKAVAGENIKI